jgi:DNA-binding transcriptional ArsR family regulator
MKMNEGLQRTRQEVYESLSELCSAFASPARLKVIQILAQAPRSVEEISRHIGESIANTSQHLQRLSKSGVVVCERKGVRRVYRIASPRVVSLWEEFQDLGHEFFDELNRKEDTLTDSSLRAPIAANEVLRLVLKRGAILIDVRDPNEVRENPVAGAKAHPAGKAFDKGAVRELGLQKDLPIYIFCRGRYCSLATVAVRELRELGYEAYRLRESPYRLRSLS